MYFAKNGCKIDYLRISVTDRCNLRCIYCMPQAGITSIPQDEILSFEEIIRTVKIFSSLGINRIRITGGEPLVRNGLINLVKSIAEVESIEDISLTTNGALLSQYAGKLKKAGLKRINISLDTLKKDRFQRITGSNSLRNVMEGIDEARRLNFSPLKLNMVVMKGINDDEIIDFVNFALKKNMVLRFIEFMKVTPLWNESFFMPIEHVIDICNREFGLRKTEYNSAGPAEYYGSEKGIIGFIKTSESNCSTCSRLRLTSTGELKLCLYQQEGIPLRDLLRKESDDTRLINTLRSIITLKEDIDYTKWESPNVYMCSVGG